MEKLLKLALLYSLVSFYTNVKAQSFGVEETVKYLNDVYKSHPKYYPTNTGTLDMYNRQFHTNEKSNDYYMWYEFVVEAGPMVSIYSRMVYSDSRKDVRPNTPKGQFLIEDLNFEKTKSNIMESDDYAIFSPKFGIYVPMDLPKLGLQEMKIYKHGLIYLCEILKDNVNYKSQIIDPFQSNTTSSNINSPSKKIVNLTQENGVMIVNVLICGKSKKFILDSGAAEVSLNPETEKLLRSSDAIDNNVNLVNGLYQTADGRIIECQRVKIKQLSISGSVYRNIIACVGESGSPLLLGRTFLNKFKSWSINNATSQLELIN